MYSVRIRKHMMIAHSLPNPVFGAAQGLHGATYVVDAEFRRAGLDEHNIVVDIGRALEWLGQILEELNYRNLDELPQFKGRLTTTEFLCKYLHDQLSTLVRGHFHGLLRITLGESHIAWASYEAEIPWAS